MENENTSGKPINKKKTYEGETVPFIRLLFILAQLNDSDDFWQALHFSVGERQASS